MNPGTLDRRIQLQRQAPGLFIATAAGEVITDTEGNPITIQSRKGRFGEELDAWGVLADTWGRRIDGSGSEATGSGRERGRQSVTYRIRYRSGLTLRDRLVEGGQAYDIVNIKEVGRRHLMDLECVLHGDSRPA